MSTQHPDNVHTPFFCEQEIIAGEAEIREAFYAYSHLGCLEQMWDFEGKEVDSSVVEKLLSRYHSYFSQHVLGQDIFLTMRVPNPSVERHMGKVLLETLESIPRNFDIAKGAGFDSPPIWEIILPMTTSAHELLRIRSYYERIVVGKSSTPIADTTVREWIGDFAPDHISIIPLIENKESLLNSKQIVSQYISSAKPECQRVFLARSDPALNYGAASAVLLAKIALFELGGLQSETSVEILPIIGVGGAPFRGNLKPNNVPNCGGEYPSVQTFTLQSSFKYDYPEKEVREAVEMLNSSARALPLEIDRAAALPIIEKLTNAYQSDVASLAPLIQRLSKHVPQRRKRKLHIGLFGYSRSLAGISLPRAIPFCASLYSIGVPPEFFGLEALTEKELDLLRSMYVHFDEDMADSAKFANPQNFEKLPNGIGGKMKKVFNSLSLPPKPENGEYSELSLNMLASALSDNTHALSEDMAKAATIRNFLG
jgi:phosphoenolpyruvate carboxylase